MVSIISRKTGTDPDHVIGTHMLQAFAFPSGDPAEMKGSSRGSNGGSPA
jgi:hypothetical protein